MTGVQPTRPIPGELLLHPLVLGAALLLVINDHFLKSAWPGFLTGKLSDIAGLLVFPLLLTSLAELGRYLTNREIIARYDEIAFPAFCGIGFIVVKCVSAGNVAYAWAVGAIRWPTHAIPALLNDDAIPIIQPILVSRDPTDLIGLPILFVPYILTRARRTRMSTYAVPATDVR